MTYTSSIAKRVPAYCTYNTYVSFFRTNYSKPSETYLTCFWFSNFELAWVLIFANFASIVVDIQNFLKISTNLLSVSKNYGRYKLTNGLQWSVKLGTQLAFVISTHFFFYSQNFWPPLRQLAKRDCLRAKGWLQLSSPGSFTLLSHLWVLDYLKPHNGKLSFRIPTINS